MGNTLEGMKMDEVEKIVAGSSKAEEIFKEFGVSNFAKNIDMGNILCSEGRLVDGSKLFRYAYRINPKSRDALLASLETELQANLPISDADIEALREIDKDYAQYFFAKRLQANGGKSADVIKVMGNAFEGFETGSSADWIYIRSAMKIIPNADISNNIPKSLPNLFFYWDKDAMPDEVGLNIEYHKDLGAFNVQRFSHGTASKFLYDFFGKDTYDLFQGLRHPSEESDFVRFHAIYALGGYYLDVDEQVVSANEFYETVGPDVLDTYVIAESGPIQSAFFGAPAGSQIIAEALRVLLANCYAKPDLSMWLKTGPGPITRALSRTFHRNFCGLCPLPKFRLLQADAFPKILRAVPVSYRNDDRDWRVYEANRSK